MWAKPGAKQPNRAGFAKWGSYINSYCLKKYGRPLFLVCSADLAGSTNIAGFGADFGDMKNTGWYNRDDQPRRGDPAPGHHRVRQRRHHGGRAPR